MSPTMISKFLLLINSSEEQGKSSQQFIITTRVKKKGVDIIKKFLACITEKTAT